MLLALMGCSENFVYLLSQDRYAFQRRDLGHSPSPAYILSSNWAYVGAKGWWVISLCSWHCPLPQLLQHWAMVRVWSNLLWTWPKNPTPGLRVGLGSKARERSLYLLNTHHVPKSEQGGFPHLLAHLILISLQRRYHILCDTNEEPCIQRLGSLWLLCKWECGNWPIEWGRLDSKIHTIHSLLNTIPANCQTILLAVSISPWTIVLLEIFIRLLSSSLILSSMYFPLLVFKSYLGPTSLWTLYPISLFRFGDIFSKLFYFAVIIDSHAIVRNNAERSCISFTQFFSIVTFYITKVKYHKQDIKFDILYQPYLDFTSFTFIRVCIKFHAILSNV